MRSRVFSPSSDREPEGHELAAQIRFIISM
jgi:hypothetical protein